MTSTKFLLASQIKAQLGTRQGKRTCNVFNSTGERRESPEEIKEDAEGRQGLGKQKPDSRGISLHFTSVGSHRSERSMGL